jgi:hypothetical protein
MPPSPPKVRVHEHYVLIGRMLASSAQGLTPPLPPKS